MGDAGMAVNLGARVWMPFRELNSIVESAVTRRQPGAVHDLEMALRKHKPDFISLLKRPVKNAAHRELVKKSPTEGIAVQGEQRKQMFSQQFVTEAIILSDLFDLNELAAVELLMAGEVQLPNYPGLTRGLVAVLLFFDGQRSLVASLRALAQAREGRTWTVGVGSEMQNLVNGFVDQLVQAGLVANILDIVKSMDIIKEMDRLQKDRALGPPKHRKQVTDLYTEIRQTLADTVFCLACQRPLSRQDTLRLLAYLRQTPGLSGDETLDKVTLSLLMALGYCLDVSLLQKEDSEEVLAKLPMLSDPQYLAEVHKEMTSDLAWSVPGIKAFCQFAWAVMLRQVSQFNVGNGGSGNDCCEDDEKLVDLALEGQVFHFLSQSVIACSSFHTEEFYLRRLHGLISDFIYQMPLKTKELRNRGDEMSRIILAHQAEGLEPPVQRGDLHTFMTCIGDLYTKDPLSLQLALEYWCPSEHPTGDVSSAYRPDPKQIALFKFVRVAGDLLPAPLFLPYVHMLYGLATGPQCAHHCFSLLRVNGSQASPVSWDHIFHSMQQYYTSLRADNSADSLSMAYRASNIRSMTPQELEALRAVLELTRHIAELNETCRSAFCENQQWSLVMVLFGLLGCSVTVSMKGDILATLAAISRTPVFAATIWQTLEAAQVLPTTQATKDQAGGIRVELEEVESRNEEYPLSQGFLSLMSSLTKFPVPMGLGAGTRSPGFDPYLDFILNSVLLKYNTRAYKSAQEKWQLVCLSLEVLLQLLTDYELSSADLHPETVEVPGVGVVAASKPPGFTVLCLLLTDSKLFKTIQQIIEEAVSMFSEFCPFPGMAGLERASLLCLELLETAGDRQAGLEARLREVASPLMLSGLERLLMSINPRTRQADYLVNVTKFVMFNASMPKHTLSAVKVLCHVCRETPSQADIINIFTADKRVSADLLHGFVECLDSNAPELPEERASALLSEPDSLGEAEANIQNQTCSHLVQLLLLSLDLAAPSLAHWLMGFQLHKSVARTTLQEPGVLDSPKTCLHSVLSVLEQGVGSREGPSCLMDRPRLAEMCYHLVFALCSNPDTSAPTLRYLRTTHDFLYRHLQHLPLDSNRYPHEVSDHQAWLLKTAAIELRMISLNHQRSHMQRLLKVLLGDEDVDLNNGAGEEGDFTVDRDSSLSATVSQTAFNAGKQLRHRILGALDTISFEHSFPAPLQFNFFDKNQVETLVRSLERRSPEGVAYVDVRALRHVLMTELASQQGPMVAGHRPVIMEEIQMILETVVEHNDSRAGLQRKKFVLDAWRQLVEVLLTSVPRDLLPGERRQAFLFDLTQELLVKVTGDEVHLEATSLASDVLLTLMANLRHCFTSPEPTAGPTSAGSAQWAGRQAGSRAAFATSLQVVLRGLIHYILKSSGGVQKVKVNLYGALLYCLQIAAKPPAEEDSVSMAQAHGMEKLLSADVSELERLAQDNMETINAYGDSLMETLCRDACDGHHVGRMLALSTLDSLMSLDSGGAWLAFLSGRGYLQHLVDSLSTEDDAQLLGLMAPSPSSLRPLYIFTSKMSLLTRIASCPEGARLLLHGGALERLAACSVLSLRPQGDTGVASEDEEGDLMPSPLARYRQLLFGVLRFCLALLTSLGGDNKEAATQVMLLLISHVDVVTSVLRSRSAPLQVACLRELALTTAVISRANHHGDLGLELSQHDTAAMEFRTHRLRIQDQMLALLPHFSRPETVVRQQQAGLTGPGASQADVDQAAQVLQLFQEVASNLTAYCRSLIAHIGSSSLNQKLLFGPSLDEMSVREGEVSVTLGRRLGLGVVVLLLTQAAGQFSQGLDTHRQMAGKLANLSQLSVEDLRQLCGSESVDRLTSQQRQTLACSRLSHLLAQKSRQLQCYVNIVENCLYIVWRHMEFFLVHCVPADSSVMSTPSLMRHQTGMRRLTGAPDSSFDTSIVGSPAVASGLSQAALGVTRADVEHLRSSAPSVLSENFFKKVHTVDQGLGKERSHYSFSEAMVRRIKRVLKLHTGN